MRQTRAFPRWFLAIGLGLWLCGTALSAQVPTVAVLFQRASDREVALRAAASPSADEIKGTIAAYEAVVRKFPLSGYADNALWQASGVALFSFNRTHNEADRANSDRLLKWLTTEYPASPFVKQAAERLKTSTSPVATTTAKPAPASTTAAAKSSGALLRGISRETLPGGDRIVLEMDREVAFTSERIPNPDRVFLDLTATGVGDGVPAAATALKGMLVTGVRLGHPKPGTTRVVLNLAGLPKHSIYPLYSPYRLVIDAEGPVPAPLAKTILQEPVVTPITAAPASTPATVPVPPAPVPAAPVTPAPVLPAPRQPAPPVAAPKVAPSAPVPTATSTTTTTTPTTTGMASTAISPKAQPASDVTPVLPANTTRKGDYSLARQLGLGVQRIVIDAGHGGHDPGAQGNGIVEKDLVLDVALRLQSLLEETPGFEVVLTRGTDEFIALEERTAIANRASADLFLSIHANASTAKEARGLETYFLNFATNLEAEKVAARENATSSASMGHLPEILKAIALNTKLAESRELASMVQTSMVRRMKTQNANVRDLGVKQAPFVVLIGAEMPSVLAEISFVTNPTDATALKQAATKQRIAQALYDGIVKYQTSLKKATPPPAKPAKIERH